MLDLRETYKRKVGNNFDLKTYHDAVLSFGSPAPKYLMQALGLVTGNR
jgi:uncharacterized protein (DUF885 family)